MKKNTLTLPDLVVLSLLAEGPMHGYQLVTELERRDVKDWASISRPQVYYSIDKLYRIKLIRKTSDSESPLGPERTKFETNEKGKAALSERLTQMDWANQRPPPPFLTWMALSSHLRKSDKKKLIETRKLFLEAQLTRERLTLESFDAETGAMVTAGRLMVEFTIQSFELELAWLRKVSEVL